METTLILIGFWIFIGFIGTIIDLICNWDIKLIKENWLQLIIIAIFFGPINLLGAIERNFSNNEKFK